MTNYNDQLKFDANEIMTINKSKYLPFLMWSFPLAFFAYQFVLRLWPGLMMQHIMEQFSINASCFGFLAALYYYGYAGMQIPVAILLNKFGARYVIFIFAIICGVATFTFSYTDNWYVACISRFLVGAGSSVGFLGVSQVITEWFPKEQYSRMVGFSFSIALMGAIYGGKPVNILISHYSWEKVVIALALISIAIGLATYVFLRSPSKAADQEISELKLIHFKTLIASPIIWLIAIANLLMVGSLEGFGDVWGVPYLMIAHNLEKNDAASLASFIYVGMLFGGPILALLSRKIGNYKLLMFCGLGMGAIFLLLLSKIAYNYIYFASLFTLVGMLCCYQVIIFATGAELVGGQLLGVTIAFLNCINMLGGSFFHTVMGYSMDLFWAGEFHEGIKKYSVESYEAAIMVIPICAIIGALIIAYVEKKVKSANKI